MYHHSPEKRKYRNKMLVGKEKRSGGSYKWTFLTKPIETIDGVDSKNDKVYSRIQYDD